MNACTELQSCESLVCMHSSSVRRECRNLPTCVEGVCGAITGCVKGLLLIACVLLCKATEASITLPAMLVLLLFINWTQFPTVLAWYCFSKLVRP